jgi:hypothetical protein
MTPLDWPVWILLVVLVGLCLVLVWIWEDHLR